MSDFPSGTVTFLFTDIEGSTQLWEKHPEAMKPALAQHDSILKSVIESNHGHIIKSTGDGVHAVFAKAVDAVNAAISVQTNLQSPAFTPQLQVKIRIGLHTGEAELRDNDYFGQSLNRAARIMSAGHGGQILISEVTAQVAREHLAGDVSLQDMDEHHLKGLLKPEHIFQVNAPELEHNFLPLQSLPTKTNNLPPQLTSFIGRERELTETTKRLEASRLVTLIGPGGTGKTRLSLQVATEQLPHFKDGVWFIELAPISDPANIVSTIASTFDLREVQGVPVLTILLDFLRAKHLLFILDNCEHLVDASAEIADQILRTAPQVKIVASSREALGINGEGVYRVPSLPDNDATRLFVERATKADSRFHLTESNASSIAQICSRLDGIPLAIELAAARVKVFSAEQIAQRLDDRFKLLTGGSRTALPRQQTLRALIDWSYTSLNEMEQRTLRRLAVFSGGWAFDGAEAVLGESEALDGLVSLVNKSLVNVEEQESESRYRFLETIRQYAMEKLLESGEAVETRNRHLDYFVQLTENAEQELLEGSALPWIVRLEAESDNLRAAFEWGMETNPLVVLIMAHSLQYFWYRRGYETEGRGWIAQALERIQNLPEEERDPSTPLAGQARQRLLVTANAWQSISFLATSQGDFANATIASRKCVELARQLEDKRLLATVLVFGASSKMMSGDNTDADMVVDEVFSIAEESDDPFALSVAHGMIGLNMLLKGQDIKTANEHVSKGLALLKHTPHHFWQTMMLFGLGMTARFQGRFNEARERLTPMLAVFRDMGDRHRANMIHSECAHMERLEGHYNKAEPMYRETILEWQRLGHRAAVANQIECFAFIAKAQEQSERAVTLFGAAEVLRELINIDMSPLERVEYTRQVADLKKNMAEKDFNAAWSKGRGMGMDEAVELAVKE